MSYLARTIPWHRSSTAAVAAGSSAVGVLGYAFWQNEKRGHLVQTTQAEPLLYHPSYQNSLVDNQVHFNTPVTKKNTTVVKTGDQEAPYPISVRAIQNARISMEDEYCIADDCFYAIFDGHGGGGVSRYLKQHLYATISHYLQSDNTPATAIQTAFRDMEHTVLNDESLKYQGSTAVAIYIQPHEILSANIGDSRAVLSRNQTSIDLTRDHKPNDAIEKERILNSGETITWDRFSKVHRVRNLSLSRAIGDAYAKPVVSSAVEIKHFARHPEQDEFIILASDGLWDVMESSEAVEFCHTLLQNAESDNHTKVVRRHMAKYLTREAVKRGSGDNVCVVMIWLK